MSKVEDMMQAEFDNFTQMFREIQRFAGTSAPNREQLGNFLDTREETTEEEALKFGAASLVLGNGEQAVAFLRNAADGMEKQWLMGLASKQQKKYANAISELRKAKDQGWNASEVLAEMVETARLDNNIKEAENYLKELQKVDAESALYLYQAGRTAESEGEVERAIELFEKAIESDPNHSPSLFRLAYLGDLHGNEDEAIELYQKCLQSEPIHVNAILNLAILHEDREEYDQAIKLLKQILKVYPNHPRARLFLKDIESSESMLFDEESEKQKDKFQQVLEMPLSDFELSVRSRNCLKKMGLRTLGDLTRISETELLAYKNFGETSLSEIKAILDSKNLRLGQTAEESASLAAASILPGDPEDLPDEMDDDILDKPIDELKLSVRSQKCLQGLNIETIGDLLEYSEEGLMKVPNFGSISLVEIKEKLDQIGLELEKSESEAE